MGFGEFLGNHDTIRRLREALGAGRLPHAILLNGSGGVGKYTLALMLAQAANCLQPRIALDGLPDFCSVCPNCVRIAAAAPLQDRISEAVLAREELRETDKKETRILVRTHPDVLVIPPDPPQLLIKIGQVRTVIRELYRVPAEARRAFYIFTASSFMKEAANSLLKALEEPPAHATLVLLSTNLQELLPTIRSRAATFSLGRIPATEIEALLTGRRPEWRPAERALVAHLSDGAPGAALAFDLPSYLESRANAFVILRTALASSDWSALFRLTESFRAGAEGQEKTTALLASLRSLLRDLMLVGHGQTAMIRNTDVSAELLTFGEGMQFEWIERALREIAGVEGGMRRNLLRSLAIDSMAAGLAKSSKSIESLP